MPGRQNRPLTARSAVGRPQSAAESGQPLNPMDLALCCVDRTIRRMGYPGFETQTLIWLSGRADDSLLRRGISRLVHRHPVITSRLEEHIADDRGYARWNYRPDAPAALQELELDSNDPECVLSCAGGLLSTPRDPSHYDPLRFYLLRRRAGGDVFLMQYNHVLMDNSASTLVVREIDRLAQQSDSPVDRSCGPDGRRLMQRYLRRFSHEQRRSAVQDAIDVNGRVLRGRAALLGLGEEDASLIYQGGSRAVQSSGNGSSSPRQTRLHVASRSLSPAQSRALHVQTVKDCGLPSLSMAILASVFRSIAQLGPAERNGQRNYVAGIGLDLNLRTGGSPLFQNLLSIVPVSARHDELSHRGELVKSLSRQIRSRLESKVDLGIVRLATGFQQRVRHMHWALEHLLRYSYSLWYAYFGSLDGIGPRFCGVPVEDAYYLGPTWSPMGIGLLASQFQGRLSLGLTYDPHLVNQTLADSFLARTLSDLHIGHA